MRKFGQIFFWRVTRWVSINELYLLVIETNPPKRCLGPAWVLLCPWGQMSWILHTGLATAPLRRLGGGGEGVSPQV